MERPPEAVGARATIRGRVIDGRGQPVRGAVVSVDGAPATAVTDGQGRFVLPAAAIGASVVVIKDGYAVGLGTAAIATADIVLAPEAAGETIVVEGEAPVVAQGAARLEREELQRIAGTGDDLVQALAAMPGVTSSLLPLGSTGVVIRGASPQDSKVLIDDFEVPTLYHNLGFRSIIPSEAIASLDYVPGGFDVAYGRASSGIVNLTTRPGGEQHTQQAELSSGELGVLAQGASGRARYMIAARRSLTDLLLPLLLPDGLDLALTTVPRFYDEQLRIDYRLSPRWELRLSSLGSDDALELYASRDRNPDKRFLDRTRFVRTTALARYHHGATTASLALSGIAQQHVFERGLYQHLHVTAPGVTARGELGRALGARAGLADVSWRVGGELAATHYAIDVAAPGGRREGEPLAPDDAMDTSTRFTGELATTNLAGWTAVSASLDPRIRLTAGVRVDAFRRARDVAVQPRAELAIKLSPRLTARASAGAYSRPPEHEAELLAGALRGERSTQLIGGASYEPADGIRVQGSLYYTDRSSLIARRAGGVLANDGRGTSHGGELLATLRRGPWFGWLAYAYSRSTRIDAPGGARRLFDHDQPHNLNVAASYRIGRWQIGARFRVHSGLPTTPVDGAIFDSDANLYYPAYGAINSQRAPFHHQLDLRIDGSWRWGRVKLTRFLDIQNAYANDSVVAYFYGFDYSQRAAFRSLPFLPTVGLRGEL